MLRRRVESSKIIHMDEVLIVRVPAGTRRRLEERARARRITVGEYVRWTLDAERLLDAFDAARADLAECARSNGIRTDDDVFDVVS